MTLFFLPKIFPKWCLFQSKAFLEKFSIDSRSDLVRPQASMTIPGKDKFDNQKLWNLKGLGRKMPLDGLVLRSTRQWSDTHLVR